MLHFKVVIQKNTSLEPTRIIRPEREHSTSTFEYYAKCVHAYAIESKLCRVFFGSVCHQTTTRKLNVI